MNILYKDTLCENRTLSLDMTHTATYHTKISPSNSLSYKPQNIIFSEGEKGEFMFSILKGEVELWSNGELFENIVCQDVFGVGAIIYKLQLRPFTAIAKTGCEVVPIDQPYFLSLIQVNPMFGLTTMRRFGERIQSLKDLEQIHLSSP